MPNEMNRFLKLRTNHYCNSGFYDSKKKIVSTLFPLVSKVTPFHTRRQTQKLMIFLQKKSPFLDPIKTRGRKVGRWPKEKYLSLRKVVTSRKVPKGARKTQLPKERGRNGNLLRGSTLKRRSLRSGRVRRVQDSYN